MTLMEASPRRPAEPRRLTRLQAEELLWSQIHQGQEDMNRLAKATHDLAYGVDRVAARFAMPTSLREKEVAPAARDLAARISEIAGELLKVSIDNLDDLVLNWQRQRALASGSALPSQKPIATKQPVKVRLDTDLPLTADAALLQLFEIGLQCHRFGRELYFLARRFELKGTTTDLIDAFLPRRPTVKHLAWHIGETADEAHCHFVDFGRELIAASKAHNAVRGTQWAQPHWDQDRILL